jgi:HAD superfamily hydrolase (TIGR01549 family)
MPTLAAAQPKPGPGTVIRYLPSRSPEAITGRSIKGVLFDMDNTLVTSTLDFRLMRQRLGISLDQDIVATMRTFTGSERAEAERIVAEMEADALEHMTVFEGTHELLQYLVKCGIPHGIITRNNLHPLTHCIETFFPNYPMSPLIHRDSPHLPKPHPDGFLFAAEEWKVDPRDVMIVGDHVDDLK